MAQPLHRQSYTQLLNLPAPPVRLHWAAFPRSCSAAFVAGFAASTGGLSAVLLRQQEEMGDDQLRVYSASQQQQLLEPTAAQRWWAGLVMEELCNAPRQRNASL